MLYSPSFAEEFQHRPHAQSQENDAPASSARLKLEAQGFAEVYRSFFAHVYRWVRALGGPEAERDDLVQEVFLIVHRRLPHFDGKNLQGWLYQITRHRVRDFRRLRWFRVFLHSKRVDDSVAGALIGSDSPEGALEAKEYAAILLGLLSKLPEAQRAAFVLFEVDGYTAEEVARLQRVPLNTVLARVRKARAKLAASIARFPKQSWARNGQ